MATGIREVTLRLPEELADLLPQAAGQRALSQDALVPVKKLGSNRAL